jgi:hypothetical protein
VLVMDALVDVYVCMYMHCMIPTPSFLSSRTSRKKKVNVHRIFTKNFVAMSELLTVKFASVQKRTCA